MPFDVFTCETFFSTLKLLFKQYKEPAALIPYVSVVPAQKRPAGSHFPSLKRLSNKCGSGSKICVSFSVLY